MSPSPLSPRLVKGAIVAIDPAPSGRSTIVFQYNSETIKRSLEPQTAGAQGGERSQALRYTGAPVETIDLEVTIDAVHQLEADLAGAARTSDESACAGRRNPSRRAGR